MVLFDWQWGFCVEPTHSRAVTGGASGSVLAPTCFHRRVPHCQITSQHSTHGVLRGLVGVFCERIGGL